MHRTSFLLVFAAAVLACSSSPKPADSTAAAAATPDSARSSRTSVANLFQERVPLAAAGDSGWHYAQRVTADLDGDNADETVVLISDVSLDTRGRPLWEDGHRWQVYVEEKDGARTHLYARFLPMGKLTASLTRSDTGTTPSVLLLEQTPDWLGAYEVSYQGPRRAPVLTRFERQLDRVKAFEGPPRR